MHSLLLQKLPEIIFYIPAEKLVTMLSKNFLNLILIKNVMDKYSQ
jgi:hypothetical protein